MDTVERITKDNVEDIVVRMLARHGSMMAWSKENQNELGGVFGAFQKAMGNPEIPSQTIDYLQPLLAYDELFFSELPTFEHRGKSFCVKTRKERGIDDFIAYIKEQLKNGTSVYLHNILWQPPYEVLGIKTSGHFMTRFALFNWKPEEKQ